MRVYYGYVEVHSQSQTQWGESRVDTKSRQMDKVTKMSGFYREEQLGEGQPSP